MTSEPTDARIAGQPIRYAGYVYDSETKLYYLQARYYHPELGRFLSRDPDKGTEDLTETQHGYSYALNNPNTFTDADGRNPLIVVFVVRGGVTVAKYYIKKNGKKQLLKTTKKVLKKTKNRQVKVIPEVSKLGRNKIHHILQDKHAWGKVVKNKNSWNDISKVISHVMRNGRESAYKSVRMKSMRINGQTVEVTFIRLKDGTIKISDAWVKTK